MKKTILSVLSLIILFIVSLLKVSEWHPIGDNIKLMNTVFWHKYNFSLLITYVFIVNLIFLLYELSKRYI